tara:strand:+ start:4650 stop:6572 length:1923 start_codon:yes stop_codon:yes gene_type:complete
MNNYKKITSKDLLFESNSYKELSFVEGFIFWVENIQTNSNTAIFAKPFNDDNSIAQNLTGNSFKIKSNFHGYGGKSYKCFFYQEDIYLIWIDLISESLWCQVFEINKSINQTSNYFLNSKSLRKLTTSVKGNFDSSFVLLNGTELLGLFEQNGRDYLFAIKINKEKQVLRILKEFDSFAGSLSCNEDYTLLSWIEWSNNMIWESNNLLFAQIKSNGQITKIREFKNKNINLQKSVSFFQPLWISKNILLCAEDSSGWWNLMFLEINNIQEINIIKRIKKASFEYGVPEWISGISLFSGSKDNLFCLVKHKEFWLLEHYQNFSFKANIELPFQYLRDLQVYKNQLVCIASSNISHEKLLKINLDQSLKVFSDCIQINEKNSSYIKAESFWFKGYEGKETHAWIYRPNFNNQVESPLLLRVHSGPTASFSGVLNLEVQYWLSRGWFVAEVNYGGSSGLGRNYRERLKMKWGIVDSIDCKNLALTLIKEGLVDYSRIIIAGNSAGGFTALNSIVGNDIFKAAICKYPVIDLNEMRLNTHRFEKNYLNSLIGEFKNNKKEYFKRSPKNNLHNIDKPVLLFHGKKDSVINFQESSLFHTKLKENNVYTELFLFEDEGHGFKTIDNKMIVLEKTEKFINYVLNFKN